jgi:formylglycine-generating enzyme
MATRVIPAVLCIAVSIIAAANDASAVVVRGINVDFVSIGYAGNAADTTGFGAVGYSYLIGKNEITNAQWDNFRSLAGTPTGSPSGAYDLNALFTGAQQPTGNVSWYEALQFCNYLTSGDKSQGVYQFGGNNANPGNVLGVNRAAAVATYGTIYFLPTENEWYKAAYFKPNGSGYSLYASGTSAAPSTSQSCFGRADAAGPWNVGSGVLEQNGTFDMMGNMWEWNETGVSSSTRIIRGGSYTSINTYLASSFRYTDAAALDEYDNAGFRIACLPVPEPSGLVLLCTSGLCLSWQVIRYSVASRRRRQLA